MRVCLEEILVLQDGRSRRRNEAGRMGSNAEILGVFNQETRLRASVDNLDRDNSPFWRARLILFDFLNRHFCA